MLLSEIPIGQVVQVTRVAGESSVRRRLMELGLVPGTRVELLRVAPLGDPIELLVRGASLSIRKAEASAIEVQSPSLAKSMEPAARRAALEPDLGV
jgi:Fe2+ transport system protein FeoA